MHSGFKRRWSELAAGILLCGMIGASMAWGQGGLVKARIGIEIKSANKTIRAKPSQTIAAGDRLRVHVRPEGRCFIYVVRADGHQARLLNRGQQLHAAELVLPSAKDFYQVDGKTGRDDFTIVCSPQALAQMAPLVEKGTMALDQWAALETELIAKGKIELGETVEKPIALAGVMREQAPMDANMAKSRLIADEDRFGEDLPLFSGQAVLVKKYAFTLQK